MDRLSIINRALMKCGLPYAAALSDCDWHADDVFDSCVEEVLRSYTWNFAMVLTPLGQSAQPPCGFTKGYVLPDDCVRVVDARCCQDLRAPRLRHVQVRGRKLYCQQSPCYLRYISKDVGIEEWPPDFADAVACRIAMEIAPLSAQTMALTPQLTQMYNLALGHAQAADAHEVCERVPHDVNIMAARGDGAAN